MASITKEIKSRLIEICKEDPTQLTTELVERINSEFSIKTNVDQIRHYLISLKLPYKKRTYNDPTKRKTKLCFHDDKYASFMGREKRNAKEKEFMQGVCYKTNTITR